MRRVIPLIFLLSLSCMPGGCQRKIAQKVSEKITEKVTEKVGEGIVEKALESQMRKEGKSGRVDIGSVKLNDEEKKFAPPGFQPKFLTETEDGFILAGLVRGKTQKDIEDFYVSSLGKPAARMVAGNQLHLSYKDAYIAIYGRSGSIEIYIYKGKKAREKIGR